MRCCVVGCKNDSRHISKSEGITFHVFPSDPSLLDSWLKAVGRTKWKPHKKSAVCSEHFLSDDLYETKNGMRKVRSGALPILTQDSNCDNGEPAYLKVCRICLATSRKMFCIRKYKLNKAYEHLIGSTMSEEDKLPQKLCYECVQRLVNCSQFRMKSLRAATLMMELIEKHDRLTTKNVKSISRKENDLASTLAKKNLGTDHYDFLIKDTDGHNEVFISEFDNIFCAVNDEIQKSDNKNTAATENQESIGLNDTKCDAEIKTQDDIKKPDYDIDDAENSGDDANYSMNEDNIDSDNYDSDVSIKPKKQKKVKKKIQKKKVPKIDGRRKPLLCDFNETLFTITDLTYEEQVAEIEKRLESSNFKNGVYKCMECYKGFLDRDAFNSHMLRHTNECGEHRCNVCKTHFKHPHALRKHITAHHTQRFSCKQCPYVTAHRQSARLHERWHKGTKYSCPHCPEQFLKFTTYMGHIRIKHPSDFVCQLCGYSFVSEKGIALHKKLKHRLDNTPITEDGPYCELCNIRFVDTEALNRHISVSAKHNSADKGTRVPNKPPNGRKSRECKERNKRSKERREREDSSPIDARKPEGPIPCEQCGMQLEDSRAYHSHFRRMHPDKNRTKYPSMKSPCMCEVCGKMFQSQALLKDHLWTHTSERPFKCELCGKSFRMKQRLVAHRRVHSEHKATYGCGACGKLFSTHSNRQRHMFIHTGLKPFKCEMCGKGFKHASEKRAHITYVHLKKPWPKRSRGKRRPEEKQAPMQPPPAKPLQDTEMQPIWPLSESKMANFEEAPPYYVIKM